MIDGTGRVEPTDDTFLFRVESDGLELWVDTLDHRFWSVHSWSAAADVRRYLKDRVERRRDVDVVWLPSDHLGQIWPGADLRSLRSDFRGERLLPATEGARDVRVQVRGHDSQELLDFLATSQQYRAALAFDHVGFVAADADFGVISEAVNRLGQFAAVGDSFELHQEVVRGVVDRYARLVRLVEARALTFEPLPAGGLRPAGGPILVRFGRTIPDMDVFLDGLFSAREPFRLWGVPEETHDGVWSVDAVDLHMGQRLAVDVSHDWLRLFLPSEGCGNTVVRLVANLQHRFDANVRFEDVHLQAALKAERAPVTAT